MLLYSKIRGGVTRSVNQDMLLFKALNLKSLFQNIKYDDQELSKALWLFLCSIEHDPKHN